MIIDCHVHAITDTPGHGKISDRLRKNLSFRFARRRLGIRHTHGEALEREAEAKLVETVNGATGVDAAVILAFDAVYGDDGRLDDANTHLYVTNDYVAELVPRHPKFLFGASVHPYRPDALAELERCVGRGAVLLKWLPIVQNFNPADARCFPLYEALAHHRVPLLCHTGGEQALPNLNLSYADPALLVPALERGVTVIAAHCGTRSRLFETDYLPTFVRLAKEHAHLHGDTAALNLPTRSYAFKTILSDDAVRNKLVHGSDWPIISLPSGSQVGYLKALKLLFEEKNWMERDVRIKQALGLDAAYWQRAEKLLRLS